MRENGIADFPDPVDGRLTVSAGPGSDLDPSSEAFQAAERACEKYRPEASPEDKAQAQAEMLKYAACMRANGVPDFPDPVDGGISISGGQGSSLDPGSDAFQAADTACASLQPGGGSTGRTGGGPDASTDEEGSA